MKKTKIIVSIIFMLISLMLCTTNVQAAMQSRPDGKSITSTKPAYFFTEIRNMESTCLGKKMNLDTTSYLDTNGNGVDVHMAKNTEWGTVALLAASAYGEAPSGTSGATTTGNATGVYQMANSTAEFTTGIFNGSNSSTSTILAADSRYYDLYEGGGKSFAKPGDATICDTWRGSTSGSFVSGGNYSIFKRGSGKMFAYQSYLEDNYRYAAGSRACLVVGAGL